MNNSWNRIIVVLFFTLFIISGVFANPIGFMEASNYGIMNGTNPSLTVNARGRQTVSYGVVSQVGGILFQETAIPGAGLENIPVSLEYRANLPDGQRLLVTIGNTIITADLYDWQLVPISRFSNSEYTACMTLLGDPLTNEEEQIENNSKNTIMWAEFHPDLINTLIGINLFFVDALLIDANLNYPLRQVTNALNGIIPGYNDITFNNRQSLLSDLYINRLLTNRRNNFSSYIYTDYGINIRYEINNGKLVFDGVPSYLFVNINSSTQTVTVNDRLNDLIREDINHIRNINPIIYRAAEQTAQWAAFFRMVKEQYPQAWERFINQIRNVETVYQIETPRYWIQE